MDVYNKNIAMRARHLDPDSLIFSMYTSEELRKLCITKICTPLTFDPLGYPLPGGLYDKSLGEYYLLMFTYIILYFIQL